MNGKDSQNPGGKRLGAFAPRTSPAAGFHFVLKLKNIASFVKINQISCKWILIRRIPRDIPGPARKPSRPSVALVGISGYGRVCLRWLEAMEARRRLRFAAAVVINPEEEREACERLRGLGVKLFRDWRELETLAASLDLCLVPTPIHWHAEIAVSALELGANVLVEKPLAGSLAQADAIQAAEAGQDTPALPERAEAELFRCYRIENFDTAVTRLHTPEGVMIQSAVTHCCEENRPIEIRVTGDEGEMSWVHRREAVWMSNTGTVERVDLSGCEETMNAMFSSVLARLRDPEARICTSAMARPQVAAIEALSGGFDAIGEPGRRTAQYTSFDPNFVEMGRSAARLALWRLENPSAASVQVTGQLARRIHHRAAPVGSVGAAAVQVTPPVREARSETGKPGRVLTPESRLSR